MDADLSHKPEDIPSLYNVMDKADIAIGSRLVKGGGSTNWPLYRRFVSFVARSLARPLTDVKDLTSGFFMLKKPVIKGRSFNPIGFKILLEILAKGNYNKALEVPIVFVDREGGKSKMGPREVLDYLKQLSILYFEKIKGKGR